MKTRLLFVLFKLFAHFEHQVPRNSCQLGAANFIAGSIRLYNHQHMDCIKNSFLDYVCLLVRRLRIG